MESKDIITFIIASVMETVTAKDGNSFFKFISGGRILDYGNCIILFKPKHLINILNFAKDDFKFRILIHADMPDGSNTGSGFTFIQELKEDLSIQKYDFITRHYSFANFEQRFIDNYQGRNVRLHNSDFINSLEFINSLPIYELKNVLKSRQTKNGDYEKPIEPKTLSSTENSKIAILTALVEDEYNICKEMMEGRDIKNYYLGKYNKPTQNDYTENIKVYTQYNKMGMVESAICAKNIAMHEDIKLVILGGVCGGRKGEVRKYDVIIPNYILDIITGALVYDKKDKKFYMRPKGYDTKINESLHNHLISLVTGKKFISEMLNLVDTKNNIENNRLREIISNKEFKIHTKVMGCGAFVLKADNFLEEKAKELSTDIVGYEMESYGFIRAVSNVEKLALVVKSVMDYTDLKKKDINGKSDLDDDKIPEGENVKLMASRISFICIRALMPYLDRYLTDNR